MNTIAETMENSTIGGGTKNYIASPFATIGGGFSNLVGVLSFYATIPGGFRNEVNKSYGFAAGRQAKVNHLGAFVWADSTDTDFESTADNQFLIRASGGVGIGTNSPDVPLHVDGGADTSVSGGGYLVLGNKSGENISIDNNEITARNNNASDTLYLNIDSGPVAIGTSSTATDYKVRVNGGSAGGAYIFAAASGLSPAVLRVQSSTDNGVALHATQTSSDATVVFSNLGSGDLIRGFGSAGPLVFSVSNNGSVNAPSFNNTSDRNAKENFTEVDPAFVLEKVAALPISQWNFKADAETSHVGPMAQDFYAAFGVGPDDKHIATVDADGVALAAIQGLNAKVDIGMRNSEDRNRELEQRLEQKETEIAELKARLDALEKRLTTR